MVHDWLARETRTAPRSGSQATSRRATVVSCGWFQASCSSTSTLGREQRARRPGATGESCRVAPPEGVLFTSGGLCGTCSRPHLLARRLATANYRLWSVESSVERRTTRSVRCDLRLISGKTKEVKQSPRPAAERPLSPPTSPLTVKSPLELATILKRPQSKTNIRGKTERLENASTLHARRGR